MSGLQAALLVVGVVVVAVLLVVLWRQVARSSEKRVEKISRELGIPLPGEEVPPEQDPDTSVPILAERPTLRARLGRTREAVADSLRSLRTRTTVDDAAWEELEDALLLADVGVTTTEQILASVRAAAVETPPQDPTELMTLLRRHLVADLATRDASRPLERSEAPLTVWMFVGVNGVGKTTTIAKLAKRERDAERTVLLAAADTFRAAAAEQLGEWGERLDAPVVRGQEGADPGSVVYDAMSSAQSRGVDTLLVDTAGRLHTKVNLMEELAKVRRIIDKTPGALAEVLLVIDASTGQNGLEQAREFAQSAGVTGVVLTKLDGTAKGGIVLAIERELGIPVKIVGLGEQPEDWVPFDALEFVDAIFD